MKWLCINRSFIANKIYPAVAKFYSATRTAQKTPDRCRSRFALWFGRERKISHARHGSCRDNMDKLGITFWEWDDSVSIALFHHWGKFYYLVIANIQTIRPHDSPVTRIPRHVWESQDNFSWKEPWEKYIPKLSSKLCQLPSPIRSQQGLRSRLTLSNSLHIVQAVFFFFFEKNKCFLIYNLNFPFCCLPFLRTVHFWEKPGITLSACMTSSR